MPIYLGFDCGGTSTRALALNDDQEVVFEGQSGPANWSSTPREEFLNHLTEAAQGAPKVDAAVICAAGVLTPQDRQELSRLGSSLLGIPLVDARPDYHAALAACPEDVTCCVIAGTGSLVFSHRDGDYLKSGGGGPLLGDHGSAFAVGRMALSLALFGGKQGPGISDRFWLSVEELFGTRSRDEVPSVIYRCPTPAALVAKLANVVAVDYEDGIDYAKNVINSQQRELAGIVQRHLWDHHRDQMPWHVYLTGGLWSISPVYRKQFERSLRLLSGGRNAVIRKLAEPPARGAARLAMNIQR